MPNGHDRRVDTPSGASHHDSWRIDSHSVARTEIDEEIHLTGRERDVLVLLAQGLQLDEIASRLGIGSETVRTHVRKASERLGAANRTHAVAIAIRRKLI